MNYIVALILVFNFFVCNGAAADAARKSKKLLEKKLLLANRKLYVVKK